LKTTALLKPTPSEAVPLMAGQKGLWVSSGTTNFGPIFPGFAVLNGEVLFQGTDTAGNTSLWVSNGAAAGTFGLTGTSGANTSGLAPEDLTVFNGEVLFGAGHLRTDRHHRRLDLAPPQ